MSLGRRRSDEIQAWREGAEDQRKKEGEVEVGALDRGPCLPWKPSLGHFPAALTLLTHPFTHTDLTWTLCHHAVNFLCSIFKSSILTLELP